MATETKICPRCKERPLNPIPALNALSRLDNHTYICPECGMEEALDALLRNPPQTEWLRQINSANGFQVRD
jgi:hypothetical protein